MRDLNSMDEQKSWARIDYDADGHPHIKGNADGLRQLRHKIDEAVLSKRTLMDKFDCNLTHIEVVDEYPAEEKQGCRSRIAFIVLGVVFVLGVTGLILLIMAGASGGFAK